MMLNLPQSRLAIFTLKSLMLGPKHNLPWLSTTTEIFCPFLACMGTWNTCCSRASSPAKTPSRYTYPRSFTDSKESNAGSACDQLLFHEVILTRLSLPWYTGVKLNIEEIGTKMQMGMELFIFADRLFIIILNNLYYSILSMYPWYKSRLVNTKHWKYVEMKTN